MGFTRWLRATSEHQLLVAAQTKVARRHGITAPQQPQGIDIFWQRVYAPAFYLLPYALRSRIAASFPGSHRKTWHPTDRARGPAV